MRNAGPFILVLLLANNGQAATDGFQPQMITLPADATASRFADIDNDRRLDLLAVDPVAKQLLVYRQRPTGFANSPDQIIAIAPRTSWIALHDVDAHPGLELVMSTAAGIVYHRQTAGVFESEP